MCICVCVWGGGILPCVAMGSLAPPGNGIKAHVPTCLLQTEQSSDLKCPCGVQAPPQRGLALPLPRPLSMACLFKKPNLSGQGWCRVEESAWGWGVIFGSLLVLVGGGVFSGIWMGGLSPGGSLKQAQWLVSPLVFRGSVPPAEAGCRQTPPPQDTNSPSQPCTPAGNGTPEIEG